MHVQGSMKNESVHYVEDNGVVVESCQLWGEVGVSVEELRLDVECLKEEVGGFGRFVCLSEVGVGLCGIVQEDVGEPFGQGVIEVGEGFFVFHVDDERLAEEPADFRGIGLQVVGFVQRLDGFGRAVEGQVAVGQAVEVGGILRLHVAYLFVAVAGGLIVGQFRGNTCQVGQRPF